MINCKIYLKEGSDSIQNLCYHTVQWCILIQFKHIDNKNERNVIQCQMCFLKWNMTTMHLKSNRVIVAMCVSKLLLFARNMLMEI
jgi:hypothetical protein